MKICNPNCKSEHICENWWENFFKDGERRIQKLGTEKNGKENSRVEMKIFYNEVYIAINGEGNPGLRIYTVIF